MAVDKENPTMRALKRQRGKRLAHVGAQAYYLRRRGKEQEMYDLVCNEFVSLGGVYVKFLQGVLFNTPLMKRWHSPNRLRIFENLESESIDVISVLQQDLTPEQLQQIALVQPEPFAAGSFGQVYLGQHVNGSTVIIKVLKPMIREMLKFDLRLLTMFSKRFAAREYDDLTVNMKSAIREFRNATLSETNYIAEARFANDLYEAYKGSKSVVIPKTYMELCTEHVIVQDYLGGISGAELLRVKENGDDVVKYVREKIGSDLDTQLRSLGDELLASAFDLPRIQGDPHPGNLRFLPENKIGLIDFGISAPAPRNKGAFLGILEEWHYLYGENGSMGAMFEQFMRFFVNDLYRALKKLSNFVPGGAPQFGPQQIPAAPKEEETTETPTPAAIPMPSFAPRPQRDLMKEVGYVVQNMFDSALGTRDVQSVLNDGRMLQAFNHMVNRGNRLGLVVQLESSEVLRAAQTFISLLEALGRRSKVLPYILSDVVNYVHTKHPEIINETERSVSASQAVDTVNRWLERVAVRDPLLFRQLLGRIDFREAMNNAKEKTTDA